MASLLGHRALCSSLLKLPPEVRSAAIQHRAFSSTPSRQLTLADAAIAGPNALLDGIHSLGIPWYAALPLTAVLVRGTFVYYFASLPGRKQDRTRALLHPLINAGTDAHLASTYAKEIADTQENTTSKGARAANMMFTHWQARSRATDEIGKPFGAPQWTSASFVNFGVLIAFTEAIRLKCGVKEGLLSIMLWPFEKVAQIVDPERFPKPPETDAKVTDPAELLAERIQAARDSQEAAATGVTHSTMDTSRARDILNGQTPDSAVHSAMPGSLPPSNDAGAVGYYYDSSLTTEGLAWFHDLTIPDPTLCFPALLFTTLLATIILRPTLGKPSTPSKRLNGKKSTQDKSEDPEMIFTTPPKTWNPLSAVSKFYDQMPWSQRLGVWLSCLFYFGAMNMPVGILLYFIPSIALGWLQTRWLDIKYPLPQPVQKCARPMRLKARRQWRGES